MPSQRIWGHLLQATAETSEQDVRIGNGHVAGFNGALWGGSSFCVQNHKPTADEEKQILPDLVKRLSRLAQQEFRTQQTWCGSRLTLQHERLPVAGEVPGMQNCFVLGGAGASGLLWLPFLGGHLANEIATGGEAVPEAFQPNRYPVDSWSLDADLGSD